MDVDQVVLKVSRETAVKMVLKVQSVNEDLLEHREALVFLDLKDHQVPQEKMVCQDIPEAVVNRFPRKNWSSRPRWCCRSTRSNW